MYQNDKNYNSENKKNDNKTENNGNNNNKDINFTNFQLRYIKKICSSW